MTNVKSLLSVRKNYALRSFVWGFGLAFLIFLPWMIFNNGYFFFYGDFNVQQIPFYQMIHDSVRSGNIGWSYTTDLGANIIGSYSFYLFSSPFFWLTIPFPSEAVPYLMAPLLMLKFAFASLAAYTFLRRYVKNKNFAVFGALMYAFSGFGIYNVFFNHFHEAMIVFPFLLAAVDAFIFEKKRGVLAVAVFAAAIVNYYFFAGQAVFVFIYWLFRMYSGSYRMTVKEFLRFVLEVVLGFAAAAVILIPSVLAVIQNSRVNRYPPAGWSTLTYSNEQRYIHLLVTFFFPPDMPAYANFTPDSNAKWASVAAWIPVFSMVGVFAFYRIKGHKWLKRLIPFLFVVAFIPLFNSAFQLFNPVYYARWFYMLVLLLVLATILSLDREDTDFRPSLKITFLITLAIGALIGFMPVKDSDNNVKGYGLEKMPDRFWIWVAIAFAGLAMLMIILNFRKKPRAFVVWTGVLLSVAIVGYANVLIGTGVLNASYRKDYIIDNAIKNRDQFSEIEDLSAVRSDFYNEMDNMGMFWQIPSIQAFQSIVPGSVMDYYNSVGVERSVGSRPKTDVYAIRSFLSCKYLFDNDSDGKKFATGSQYNLMPGWDFLMEKNGYKVYENQYYIPYGFTYDTYVTEEEYNDTSESNRSKLMLKSIVLTEEQAEKYGSFLSHDEHLEDYKYSQSEYFEDCEARRKLTCSKIVFENNCFTAQIKTGNSDELVFFSIPYEKGWSAQVNGQDVDVEKVNVGFMAVKVPANTDAEIRFTYKTPGLSAGLVVSAISGVGFVVYMFLWKGPKKRRDDEPETAVAAAVPDPAAPVAEDDLGPLEGADDAKIQTIMKLSSFFEQETEAATQDAEADNQDEAEAEQRDEASETSAPQSAPDSPEETHEN